MSAEVFLLCLFTLVIVIIVGVYEFAMVSMKKKYDQAEAHLQRTRAQLEDMYINMK